MSEAGKTPQTSNSWLCAGELFSVTSTLFISVKLHFSLVCTLKSGHQWNSAHFLICHSKYYPKTLKKDFINITYIHQGYIYVIKNTVKTVILLQF